MNARFKFRVWDKENNKYEDDLYYEAGDLQVTCVNKIFEEYISDGYIIEQCTGLKDKNGKLIYEGDIVREISKREPEWEEYVITVEWKGCGFNLYGDDEFDFLVIGNIHENADLLENEE